MGVEDAVCRASNFNLMEIRSMTTGRCDLNGSEITVRDVFQVLCK